MSHVAGIVKRIHRELADLERVLARAKRAWSHAPTSADPDMYADSVALNLQGLYTGLERVFEQIARQLDNRMPAGKSWHLELLRQMRTSVPAVRPAVIGDTSFACLDELRRFRHVVRNVYATNLNPKKLGDLMDGITRCWPLVRAELLAFADFLDTLEENENTP
jgi:hypothetical protein